MLCFSRGPTDFVSMGQTLDSSAMNMGTYKRKSAVPARSDFGLVGVDKDSGMAERTATTVAGDDSLLGPPHGLFVNQLNGGVWLGLYIISYVSITSVLHVLAGVQFSKSNNVSQQFFTKVYRPEVP